MILQKLSTLVDLTYCGAAFHSSGSTGAVARLFRGEGLIADAQKIPASEDARYSNPLLGLCRR